MNRFFQHPVVRRVIRVLLVMTAALLALHLYVYERRIWGMEFGFSSMSTFAKSRLYVKDQRSVAVAARSVRDAFREVEKLCNIYDPESELSRLNASAHREAFVCSDDLWEILTEARRFYKLSDGAFDVTITPFMRLWGFHSKEKRLPDPSAIAAAKAHVGLDKVKFDDAKHSVRFPVEGMSIDLGGIAKGWALDRAAEKLSRLSAVGDKIASETSFADRADAWFRGRLVHFDRGFIDLGGNAIAFSEPPPDAKKYKTSVRNFVNPRSGETCAAADLLGEAVSTSGSYERYTVIDGKHYSHIVDPASGLPVENMLSVSVIAKRAVDADALSTAIFVKGPAFAEKMAKEFPGLRVLIFYRDAADPKIIKTFQIGEWDAVSVPVEK